RIVIETQTGIAHGVGRGPGHHHRKPSEDVPVGDRGEIGDETDQHDKDESEGQMFELALEVGDQPLLYRLPALEVDPRVATEDGIGADHLADCVDGESNVEAHRDDNDDPEIPKTRNQGDEWRLAAHADDAKRT